MRRSLSSATYPPRPTGFAGDVSISWPPLPCDVAAIVRRRMVLNPQRSALRCAQQFRGAPLMKSLLAIFAAVLLSSVAPRLAAQDLAPPRLISSPPEQTPAPSSSAPAAKPSPAVAATPEASKTPKPKKIRKEERTVSSPRRGALRQEPVRAVETPPPFRRSRSPSASRPTFDLSESSWVVAVTLRSLESRWEDAVKNHDSRALSKLMSSNFEASSANGVDASKSRILSLLERDKNVYRSARAHGMRVRSLGGGTAVVTGVSSEGGETAGGKKFSVSREFSDTWKLRDGRWQCVASRVSNQRHR